MAIVFPLMFLMLAGIVDLGRAFFYQIQLTNAAREGVRTAIVTDGDTALILERARNSAPAVTGLLTTLDRACPGGDPLATTQVTASTPMEWYLLKPAMNIITAGGFPAGLETLSSTAVMQCGG